MTQEQLESESGLASTTHGGLIDVGPALRLADEADVVTTVLTATGGILDYGSTRRGASPAQRRALAARDRGCSFPGCTAPPAWTQAHHVVAWQHGGPTGVDNLTLVCGFHHREFERNGWSCRMTDGTPWWVPPAWIDPHRQPRRNCAHHLERLLPDPSNPTGPPRPP